jgi:hypothetical protein
MLLNLSSVVMCPGLGFILNMDLLSMSVS